MVSICLILFIATFIRSTFGFGEALIAVPLLAFVIPVNQAAPLAAMVSVTVALIVVARNWRHIHFSDVGQLVAATILGIPFGLGLLVTTEDALVKIVLGLIIASFSADSLLRTQATSPQGRFTRFVFGFLAGALGGAYGMNGPPLVIYAARCGWSPQEFRTNLQGYFLFASAMGLLGFWSTGLVSAAVINLYLLTLPISLIAIAVGAVANRNMSARSFTRYVHVFLVLIGISLMAQPLLR